MSWWTTLWEHDLWPVQWGAVLGASLAGAVVDVRSRRLPNWLTGPAFIAGLVWAIWIGGWNGAADSLAGALGLMVPYVLLFVFAGGGAGDAKMMGAAGAWLGVLNGGIALVAVAVAGMVLAIAYALAARQMRLVLATLFVIMVNWATELVTRASPFGGLRSAPAIEEMKTVPYGVAIFTGMALAAGGLALWRL